MIITLEYGAFKEEYNLDPKICGWSKIYETLNWFTKQEYINSKSAKKILLKIKESDIEKDFENKEKED